MGLFDMFGGGSKVEKLQKAATQKFGPPENRQKALNQLAELDSAEAIAALLRRFTIAVDPSITDREEKEFTQHAVVEKGVKALEPLKAFIMSSETGVAWALKCLASVVTPADVAQVCIETLQKLGNDYTRDPEKKVVLLRQLAELDDARIGPAALPFIEDPADDVKISAAQLVAKAKVPEGRVALLEGLVRDHDKKRVLAAFTEALHTAGFNVEGYREKVAPLIADPFTLDKAGAVTRKA